MSEELDFWRGNQDFIDQRIRAFFEDFRGITPNVPISGIVFDRYGRAVSGAGAGGVGDVGVSLLLTNDVSTTGGSAINVDWEFAQWDTHGHWSLSDPDTIYIQQDGTYIITGGVLWDSGTYWVDAELRVNSHTVAFDNRFNDVTDGNGGTAQSLSRIYQLVAGDLVRLRVGSGQNGGFKGVGFTDRHTTHLAIQRLS